MPIMKSQGAMSSKLRKLFYGVLKKIHQWFLIVIHVLFKIANFGEKEPLPEIRDPILLNSASSLALEIRKGKLKSVDAVQTYIERIQEVNPFINAIAEFRIQEALEEAAEVDKLIESGQKTEEELERETPFLGVPFTSKEIINVAGMPITVGVVRRKGLVADKDSQAVHLMRNAGAIPIAVTNIGELAMWPESYNKVYGRTCNAYDPSRTTGGSTGGEGALLGAAGSVIGLGNDIGGSIRIPSCFNGIFGHKPSPNIVPNEGCTSFVNDQLDCFLSLGPMCRYASDLLPMMKILSGSNANVLRLQEPVKVDSLKIYYIDDTTGVPLITNTHADVKAAVQKAVQHFENTYQIKPQKLDLKYVKHAVKIYQAKVCEKGGFHIDSGLASKDDAPVNYLWELLLWVFCLSNHVFHILLVGIVDQLLRSANHSAGLKAYTETLQAFQEILDDNSVFLCPTWPEPAPHHNEPLFKPYDFSAYTGLFNVLQFPATQCPMGLGRDGLPLGIQVVANNKNDRLTLAVAMELEKAFGGWVPPSPIPE